MLALKNIQILYDRAIEAVRDVSLDVPTGQIVALLGSNGAGKSTILKAISGVLYQEDGEIMSGSIQLEGEQISGRTPRDIVEKGVLQVPEGRALFATLTVEENLLMGGFTAAAPRRWKGWSASTRCSRGSRNGGRRFPATCPAASSRWSRSAVR